MLHYYKVNMIPYRTIFRLKLHERTVLIMNAQISLNVHGSESDGH